MELITELEAAISRMIYDGYCCNHLSGDDLHRLRQALKNFQGSASEKARAEDLFEVLETYQEDMDSAFLEGALRARGLTYLL